MSDASPTRDSLSKTPSWVMLGFVVGCIVMWTIKTEPPPGSPARTPVTVSPPIQPTIQAPPPPPVEQVDASLSDLEAVFDQWKAGAVWEHDITEVAFWSRTKKQYSDYVEVLRSGDDYYFRSIPKLTRPLIEEGVPRDAPIKFTEPQSVRDERRSLYVFPQR